MINIRILNNIQIYINSQNMILQLIIINYTSILNINNNI